MLLHGAFTALLLLLGGVSAGFVLRPTNVTVRCQNLKVTVSWEYSEQQPHTSFRVHLGGSAGSYSRDNVMETTEHQYDLSHFIWESEERYMDLHYVAVTAVQGGNQSEPEESQTFSFNSLKTAAIKCKLNFPPVSLTVEDSGATVSFRNPLHYYGELQQARKPDEASFAFNVTSGGKSYRYKDCKVEQEICKHAFQFPEGAEQCVTLTGQLFDGNRFGVVPFNDTGSVCPSNSTGVHMITLVVLLSVTVLLISVITVIICKIRAWTWTDKMVVLPETLDLLLPNPSERDVRYCTVSKPAISTVAVMPSSQEQDELGSMSEGRRTDDDSADDSEKTECVSMDLEEEELEEVSPYNSPQNLQMDMGDGDMVTGYSGRTRNNPAHNPMRYCTVSNTAIGTATVMPNGPRRGPSVSSEDSCARHRLSEGRSQEQGELRSVSGEWWIDEDSADDSESVLELEVSPYDSPQNLQVDMGDGDMVTGYSGR